MNKPYRSFMHSDVSRQVYKQIQLFQQEEKRVSEAYLDRSCYPPWLRLQSASPLRFHHKLRPLRWDYTPVANHNMRPDLL